MRGVKEMHGTLIRKLTRIYKCYKKHLLRS